MLQLLPFLLQAHSLYFHFHSRLHQYSSASSFHLHFCFKTNLQFNLSCDVFAFFFNFKFLFGSFSSTISTFCFYFHFALLQLTFRDVKIKMGSKSSSQGSPLSEGHRFTWPAMTVMIMPGRRQLLLGSSHNASLLLFASLGEALWDDPNNGLKETEGTDGLCK